MLHDYTVRHLIFEHCREMTLLADQTAIGGKMQTDPLAILANNSTEESRLHERVGRHQGIKQGRVCPAGDFTSENKLRSTFKGACPLSDYRCPNLWPGRTPECPAILHAQQPGEGFHYVNQKTRAVSEWLLGVSFYQFIYWHNMRDKQANSTVVELLPVRTRNVGD
jgi:hypothetical protein